MNALIDNVTDDGYFVGDVGMVAFECDVEYACAERCSRRCSAFSREALARMMFVNV